MEPGLGVNTRNRGPYFASGFISSFFSSVFFLAWAFLAALVSLAFALSAFISFLSSFLSAVPASWANVTDERETVSATANNSVSSFFILWNSPYAFFNACLKWTAGTGTHR